MIKRIALLTFLIFSPFVAYAATATNCDGIGNCYVRAGASGSGNGSNWTNACSGFTGTCAPSSMTRGATYWVANGNYGTVSFNTPTSGTSVITIKGATTSSHGPATDWSNSYAGQAVFSGDSAIPTNYWTFDGQQRNSDWRSGYTIKFANSIDPSGFALGINSSSGTFTNWTIDYVEILGTDTAGSQNVDEGFQCQPKCNTIYLGHSWIHNVGSDNISANWGDNNGSGWIMEYNWISYNHRGYNGYHSQCAQVTASNMIWRYNVFQDCMSSGFITDASGGTPSFGNWELYGNVFFWDAAFAADSRNFIGDGVVGLFGQTFTGHMYFYNNTIVGISSTNTCNASAFYAQPAGTLLVNNVWMNTTGCGPYDGSGGSGTMDYNSYFQNSSNSNDTSAHKQTLSTNPFVNVAAFDFRLVADTTPGTALAAPYNLDMYGALRGMSGTWDRGAIQVQGLIARPNPPTNVTAIAN
jgi:hypothetical protein